jgi:ketosteroid isomerase-like protein
LRTATASPRCPRTSSRERPDAQARDTARGVAEENLEIVRERFALFIGSGENRAEWYAPEFVWDMSTFGGWPEKQQYPGAAGVDEFLSSWLEAWDDWHLELEEARQADDGRVVAISRQSGRSKATGLEAEMRFAQVWTLRNGLYIRMEMYADPDEALRATGLPTQG